MIYKLVRDPGLRRCTWGGARIREFANPGVLSSIGRAPYPQSTGAVPRAGVSVVRGAWDGRTCACREALRGACKEEDE